MSCVISLRFLRNLFFLACVIFLRLAYCLRTFGTQDLACVCVLRLRNNGNQALLTYAFLALNVNAAQIQHVGTTYIEKNHYNK